MKATKSGDVAKDTLDVHPPGTPARKHRASTAAHGLPLPALSVDNDGYDAPVGWLSGLCIML